MTGMKNSRKLASAIVKARGVKQIVTIGDFLEVIKSLFGREREKKELAKVFQAFKKKITFTAQYVAAKVIFIRSRLLNDLYYISLKTSSLSCSAASTQEP